MDADHGYGAIVAYYAVFRSRFIKDFVNSGWEIWG